LEEKDSSLIEMEKEKRRERMREKGERDFLKMHIIA
jgi:hypothetical protein